MRSANYKAIHNTAMSVIRIIIGILFILSSIFKVSNLLIFEDAFISFNIFPQYSKAATLLIPSVEFISGIFLILGIFKKLATAILGLLVFLFTLAIGLQLIKSNTFDCGCFGPIKLLSSISTEKIIFNLTLIAILSLLYFTDHIYFDFYNGMKIISTYTIFSALLLNIPFSNHSLSYNIALMNIEEIDWNTAISLVNTNNSALVDARSNTRYVEGHVPGAINIPIDDFSRFYSASKADIDEHDSILVYCDGKECAAAIRIAQKLIARGYKNIMKIEGGYDAWLR